MIRIRVAGDCCYPPYEYVDNIGAYQGYNVNLMSNIALEEGFEIEFLPMSWQEAQKALIKGEVDLIQGMNYSPERAKQFQFCIPITMNKQTLFISKNSRLTAKTSIGIQEGDVGEDLCRGTGYTNIIRFKSYFEGIKALVSGDIQAFMGNEKTIAYLLENMNCSLNYEKLVVSQEFQAYCPVVRKGNMELYSRINTALTRLSAFNGSLINAEKIQSGDKGGDYQETTSIIGNSPGIRELKKNIGKIKDTVFPVLITGETGTGKDLVAKEIHKQGKRKNGRLEIINCAALPVSLLESELFGHEKGAFTGASSSYPGKFILANGGSLFLDEIGEIPLEVQAKLLRVLQDKIVTPLGSIKHHEVDVRIIAATNKDLREEVNKGRFREDLYYRLNVIDIKVPPLRERREDIPLLIEHFTRKITEELGCVKHISVEVMNYLQQYGFPGNVRELENILERAYAMSEGNIVVINDLPPYLLAAENDLNDLKNGIYIKMGEPLSIVEKKVILMNLRNSRTRKDAARILGITEPTLRQKIKKYCLEN